MILCHVSMVDSAVSNRWKSTSVRARKVTRASTVKSRICARPRRVETEVVVRCWPVISTSAIAPKDLKDQHVQRMLRSANQVRACTEVLASILMALISKYYLYFENVNLLGTS